MKTTSLPPVRVEPATRALFESVLREGESLSQFIQTAAREEAEWRQQQAAFVARGESALEDYRQRGNGGRTIEQALAELRERSRQGTERLRAETTRRAAASS